MSIVTDSGQKTFWSSVISRTATGAGADVKATERALPRLVPSLINRFATARGYELYEDAKPSSKLTDILDKTLIRPSLLS